MNYFQLEIKEYDSFTAVNVQFLDICSCACDLGKKLEIPVYKFLKTPLTKRFGEDWYAQMEKIGKGND